MPRTVCVNICLLVILVTGPLPAPAQTAAALSPPAASAAWPAASHCPPLPAPSGRTVNVATEAQLLAAVDTAQAGDTILLADGTYSLGPNGRYVWIDTPNVTLRSASGNRAAVVLDDNWSASETVTIAASNVTIADLTLQRAGTHPIHVISSAAGNTDNTLIYNVHLIDPGQQAIKINPHTPGYTLNTGVVACSHLELTEAGRAQVLALNGSCYTGGVDGHNARAWVIRDNLIEGFWCSSGGLSEHGIHLWHDSQDTLVERNWLVNNARGIGFGMESSAHFGGTIRNNLVHTVQDVGIGLESAPNARVYHNSLYTENYSNSIEYRFAATSGVEIINNLSNGAIVSRDSGTGSVQTNLTSAQASWFSNATQGDLHLAANLPSVVDQAQTLAAVTDDFDGEARPYGPASDLGADEYVGAGLTLVATPANQALYLTWQVDVTLPATATWTIDYAGPGGAEPPITGLANATRAYTLSGLTNYAWYTVTLTAVGPAPGLSDTVRAMPTDRFNYLPLIQKGHP